MQAKQNLTLALFTSFLVLVLGAAIWGLLYYYGIFSAWVALFATAGASACYLKFYNRKNALLREQRFRSTLLTNMQRMVEIWAILPMNREQRYHRSLLINMQRMVAF